MSMRWATLGRGRLYFWLMTLPAVLYVVVWRLAPALYTLWLSMTQYNIVYDTLPRWNHFENFGRILRDSGLRESLSLSVEFAVIATAAELVIGLAAALFFDTDPPSRNLLLGLFMLPMIMAPVVVGTAWSTLFDRTVGPIPYLFQVLHGPDIQWLATPATAMFALLIADAWEWAPLVALLLFAALQVIPHEQYEAARVDGASAPQLFLRITLPQIAGMILVAAGLRVMDAFLELDKVFVMTGGGPGSSTQFVSMFVYKQAFQFYELGYASAVITVVLALLAVAYAMYLRSYGRALRPADSR
ncbi:MAG: sugar ABC transporter permease [Bacillati bacterium ANGP1]|uniref:Sugar ABC transporter permease n=1 Tax=Candidatus Segetimicrobium genomatis TaxID=2569760 RepID=A0A537M9F1_9BACT|nr:MAG: sugar ABC transporter permease [Terrabacteria group bacterium ANGP1]